MKIIDSPIEAPAFLPSYQNKTKMAFFDIETTGLSPDASSLYLIGALYYDGQKGTWKIRQWFADDYKSEKQILSEFFAFLSSYTYLYHFNGNTFDLPYLQKKCRRHQLYVSEHVRQFFEDKEDKYSIDLLKHIRKLKRLLLLPKCSQTSVETWLGIKRTDAFSGKDLIPIYSEYMQQKLLAPQKAEALEKVLLLHNHDDVEMMLSIGTILQYESIFNMDFPQNVPLHPLRTAGLLPTESLEELSVKADAEHITLSLPLTAMVPKEIACYAPFPAEDAAPSLLSLEKDRLTVTFPLYHGTLKHFLADYANYYYLPKEDCAIHKSIAEYVEKPFRQKAAAATCYIKKKGVFLPLLSPYRQNTPPDFTFPIFQREYKDKLAFVELPAPADSLSFWKQCLPKQIKAAFYQHR